VAYSVNTVLSHFIHGDMATMKSSSRGLGRAVSHIMEQYRKEVNKSRRLDDENKKLKETLRHMPIAPSLTAFHSGLGVTAPFPFTAPH
jgi:hypothetical protein